MSADRTSDEFVADIHEGETTKQEIVVSLKQDRNIVAYRVPSL